MGASNARANPNGSRICELPGCDRRAAVGKVVCGAHLEDFANGMYPVWNGGELLPRLERASTSYSAWLHVVAHGAWFHVMAHGNKRQVAA